MAGDQATTRVAETYGSEVIKSLSNLRETGDLCDFTLHSDGRSFRVHKVLLAATSDYFRAMLCGGMRESTENRVELKGVSADSLGQILDFLYSGSLRLDADNLSDLLNAASHLQVAAALALCSDYMVEELSNGCGGRECDALLELARTYCLTAVLRRHDDATLADFEHFSRTEPFLRLSASQLASYLASDALVVTSEVTVFNAVARWHAHETADRGQHLETLIGCVRFSLMTESELTQLMRHALMSQYPACGQHIAHGLKYHSDSLVGHPPLSHDSDVRVTCQSLVIVHQGSLYRPFEVTAYRERDERFYQLLTDTTGSHDCRIDVIDNMAYVCGVLDCGGGALVSSLLRFDPRHVRLQALRPCRRLRIEPALVADDSALYLFGGKTENNIVLDSVERYDVHANAWRELESMPTRTHSLAAVLLAGTVYLSGGVNNGQRHPTDALLLYVCDTREWSSGAPMHCARRLHEMVAVEDRLFVFGGLGCPRHQNEIPTETYNPLTGQWTLLTHTLAGRSVGHFVHFDGSVLSLGREHSGAAEDDIWRYEHASDTWRPYAKIAQRASLALATAILLTVNYNDCRVSKTVDTSTNRRRMRQSDVR